MDIPVQNIAMIRETLADFPRYSLLPDYSIRWYQPGDANHWYHIHLQADEYNQIVPESFAHQFGSDEAVLARRQSYLLDGAGMPIGTATAWYRRWEDGRCDGLIHWVAILPEWQGRGLAKPLLSAICRRLQQLGHQRVTLNTATVRIAAVNLYLHFGFVPQIRHAEDVAAWQALRPYLKYPLKQS